MTQTNTAMSKVSHPNAKHVLLGEQTAWTLLANMVHIYRHHFSVLVGAAGLPFVLPVIIVTLALSNLKPEEPHPALIVAAVAGFGLGYINLFFVPAVVTVVLSDICLGNTPTLKRAFARVLGRGRWWHLFTTTWLAGMAILLGLILLIVPGLWLIIRTLFFVPAVVLEDRRNRGAIRRSLALTKGQAWRLTGLYFLTFLLTYLASFLFGSVVGVTGTAVAGPESALARLYLPLLSGLISFVLTVPAFSMLVVLLYYDQRVRRESYDAQALAEDLMR
jgi:glycerophosphoryl diester phosphodiesterase family protein